MPNRTLYLVLLALATSCYEGADPRALDPDPPQPRDARTQKGRLTSVGNGEYREWYDYDTRGHVVQTWWQFDGRNYVASTTYGWPTRAASAGEVGTVVRSEALAHRTNAAAEHVHYEHDAVGVARRVIAERPDGTRQTLVQALRTNALGQLTRVVYGTCSGAACDASEQDRVVTERNYDAGTLRLSSVVTRHNAEVLQSLGYEFDPNGNLVVLDDARDEYDAHYDYDSLDRLAQVDTGGFALAQAYDVKGNLVLKDRVVDGTHRRVAQSYAGDGRGPHALATSDAASFSYDGNGNLERTSGREVDLEVRWNADNMPVAMQSAGAAIYRKHFVGDVLWKKVEGATTTFYLPGVRITATGSADEVRVYYGDWAELDPAGAFHFHRTDHLGSASMVFDARGQVEHRASYWAWGEDRDDAAGTFDPIYEYNFKEKELGTGDSGRTGDFVYDFGGRLYLPETGRMASPDPSTLDGPNRYAYARNNPVRYTDPSGYAACEPEDNACGQDPPVNDIPAPAGTSANPGDTIVVGSLDVVQVVAGPDDDATKKARMDISRFSMGLDPWGVSDEVALAAYLLRVGIDRDGMVRKPGVAPIDLMLVKLLLWDRKADVKVHFTELDIDEIREDFDFYGNIDIGGGGVVRGTLKRALKGAAKKKARSRGLKQLDEIEGVAGSGQRGVDSTAGSASGAAHEIQRDTGAVNVRLKPQKGSKTKFNKNKDYE